MAREGYETDVRFFADSAEVTTIHWYKVPVDRPCLPYPSFVWDSDWANDNGPRTTIFKGNPPVTSGEQWALRPVTRRPPLPLETFTGHFCGTKTQWSGDLRSDRPEDQGEYGCCIPIGTMVVTSVGLALPDEFTVTGSPVTSTGVLTGTWVPVFPHFVLAGPNSGAVPAEPEFRPLAISDLPLTGVAAGSFGDATHYPTFTVLPNGTLQIAGQLPFPAASIPVPLILDPPTDATKDLILKQHSPTQTANLLECETHTGVPFGASITGNAEFSGSGQGAPGSENECFGLSAGKYLQFGGSQNTLVGFHAGIKTYSQGNTLVGTNAGASNRTGNFNTIVGKSAGLSQTTATGNTVVGTNSLYYNLAGNHIAAFGYAACQDSLANDNTAHGWKALYHDTTGYCNTALGSKAGFTVTIGHNNTCVGCDADVASGADNNSVVIGAGVIGHGSGTVTIGTLTDNVWVGSAQFPASVPAGQAFMSPSGGPGAGSFRTLVASDIPNLDASKITSGNFAVARLDSLDAIAAFFGVLSATNVGAGYPWAFLSGVPSFATCTFLNRTQASTDGPAFTTMFNAAGNGLHGSFSFKNNGPNTIAYQWVVIDAFGATNTFGASLVTNAITTGEFDSPSSVGFAGASLPLQSVTFGIHSAIPGNPGTVHQVTSVVGC